MSANAASVAVVNNHASANTSGASNGTAVNTGGDSSSTVAGSCNGMTINVQASAKVIVTTAKTRIQRRLRCRPPPIVSDVDKPDKELYVFLVQSDRGRLLSVFDERDQEYDNVALAFTKKSVADAFMATYPSNPPTGASPFRRLAGAELTSFTKQHQNGGWHKMATQFGKRILIYRHMAHFTPLFVCKNTWHIEIEKESWDTLMQGEVNCIWDGQFFDTFVGGMEDGVYRRLNDNHPIQLCCYEEN
jgi:hypothetical protein